MEKDKKRKIKLRNKSIHCWGPKYIGQTRAYAEITASAEANSGRRSKSQTLAFEKSCRCTEREEKKNNENLLTSIDISIPMIIVGNNRRRIRLR